MKNRGDFIIYLLQGILLLTGVAYVFIAPFDQNTSLIIKPLFFVTLFSFYFASTKKFKWKLFFALTCVMLGEYFATKGFVDYYNIVILFYTGFYFFATWLLLPVIRNIKVKKVFSDLTMIVLSAGGFVFVVFWVYHFTLSNLNQILLDIVAIGTFVLFISCIFYITQFNKQPKSVYIFITAIGYMVVVLGYVIYEFAFKVNSILILVNFAEIVAQYCFIKFVISRKEIIIYSEKDRLL
ncbi:MAG: hypothetical protein HKN48_08040 [Flavobacteriaceae bacterium]|nr:hypothetical protein [Flavobacteriaceae bacterium]